MNEASVRYTAEADLLIDWKGDYRTVGFGEKWTKSCIARKIEDTAIALFGWLDRGVNS